MSERALSWCWILLGLFIAAMFQLFMFGLPAEPQSGKWYACGLMTGYGTAMFGVGLSMLENTKRGKPWPTTSWRGDAVNYFIVKRCSFCGKDFTEWHECAGTVKEQYRRPTEREASKPLDQQLWEKLEELCAREK